MWATIDISTWVRWVRFKVIHHCAKTKRQKAHLKPSGKHFTKQGIKTENLQFALERVTKRVRNARVWSWIKS